MLTPEHDVSACNEENEDAEYVAWWSQQVVHVVVMGLVERRIPGSKSERHSAIEVRGHAEEKGDRF